MFVGGRVSLVFRRGWGQDPLRREGDYETSVTILIAAAGRAIPAAVSCRRGGEIESSVPAKSGLRHVVFLPRKIGTFLTELCKHRSLHFVLRGRFPFGSTSQGGECRRGK